MTFTNKLLTDFLDDSNIQYHEEDDMVSFEYEKQFFLGTIGSTPAFESFLGLILPEVCEVTPSEAKKYFKLINRLNSQLDVVKFVFDEKYNSIYISAEIPLDSSPEMKDLVPGLVKLLVDAQDKFDEADN